MSKVTILGAGSWGTALAMVAAKNQHDVVLWGRNPEKMAHIKETRENPHFLPGIVIPEEIAVSWDLKEAVERAEVLFLVVPSTQIRGLCRQIRPYIKNNPLIINTAKGIEVETLSRLSEVVEDELAGVPHQFCFLSGPSHAEEVARSLPTVIVASSKDNGAAKATQNLLMSVDFRVYTNSDLIGVELAAALKNVIAMGIGVTRGLGYGDNAMAGLITRGLAEVSRLGVAAGANPATFAGLAGIGDMIVTCTSEHSRNRKAGVLLGQGHPLEQVLEEVGMVVEGVRATEAAEGLSRRHNVYMPICHQLYEILFQGKDPKDAVFYLMTRSKKDEKN